MLKLIYKKDVGITDGLTLPLVGGARPQGREGVRGYDTCQAI